MLDMAIKEWFEGDYQRLVYWENEARKIRTVEGSASIEEAREKAEQTIFGRTPQIGGIREGRISTAEVLMHLLKKVGEQSAKLLESEELKRATAGE